VGKCPETGTYMLAELLDILYIYCMLVREIWKFIHPRVSYFLREIWYSWVNKFSEEIFLKLAIVLKISKSSWNTAYHITTFKKIETKKQTFIWYCLNKKDKTYMCWCLDSPSWKYENLFTQEYHIFWGKYDTRGWINFHISWTRMLLMFYYTEWNQENTYM
jgi:hypothetical protein